MFLDKLFNLFIIFLLLGINQTISQESSNIDSKVQSLVSQMTLEEKVSQLNTDYISAIPRLNIPLYIWHNEALHGIITSGATVFPIPTALAATFDIPLMFEVATAISDEGRAFYNLNKMGLNYWSPNLDLVRDPRWGRSQETYGEDPYLASRMGVAFIKGMQGNHPKYLKTITSPKHFAVHSGPESIKFLLNPQVNQRDVWETYMPPFQAVIEEGKSYSIMCAYNAYYNIPISVNRFLINDIVRKKWGLKGYVMNDCGALSITRWGWQYAENEYNTVKLALEAGLDLECGEYYYNYLKDAYLKNFVTMDLIDTAVFRLFKARFMLGLFEPKDSVPYNFIPDTIIECQKHRELSVKAARESMVLLKNENKLLPISKDLKSIYVVGPNADAIWEMIGAYAGYPSKYWTSTLQAIKNKVGDKIQITHYKGCEIMGMITEFADSKHFKTPDGKPGLRAEYYNNKDLQGEPSFIRIDSAIDFHWKRISPITGSDQGEPFSVRWTGTIQFDKGGCYTFNVISNDGARLYINNKKIVDSWWEHGAVPFVGFDTLEGGVEYPFKLEYFFNQSWAHVRFEFGSDSTSEELYDLAMQEAKKHDLIIFVGGLSSAYESENNDRLRLDFPDGQLRLLKSLKRSGVPIVLVNYSGSSVSLNWAKDSIPAILQAWYGGQEAGVAVADIIFGDYNPAGRLPVTFYKSEKDLPPFEDYSMEGRTYRYFRKEPLYPFGYGLSYTTFDYSDLNIPINKIILGQKDTIPIIFNIENTGDFDGDEVVQLYVTNLTSKHPQPIKQLKGFKRIHLKQNGQKKDTIFLAINQLYYYDTSKNDYAIEPSKYEIQIASSSADVRLKGEIELIPSTSDNTTINPYSIKIFPNPAMNYIIIPDFEGEIAIYDILGKQILKTKVSINQKVNLEAISSGIYIIKYSNKFISFLKF
jgi:beta-glucosidase